MKTNHVYCLLSTILTIVVIVSSFVE